MSTDTGGPVETLVEWAIKARPEWTRHDVRRAIANAVNEPLHKLTLDKTARPQDLAALIQRTHAQQATVWITSNQPPPADEVLGKVIDGQVTDPPLNRELLLTGVAAARSAMEARKTQPTGDHR